MRGHTLRVLLTLFISHRAVAAWSGGVLPPRDTPPPTPSSARRRSQRAVVMADDGGGGGLLGRIGGQWDKSNKDRLAASRRLEAAGLSRPPNMGGERVVISKPKPLVRVREEDDGDNGSRRAVVGAGLVVASLGWATVFSGGKSSNVETAVEGFGDAVTAPQLETDLEEIAVAAPSPAQSQAIRAIIDQLEEQGGAALPASNSVGRWVIPWVGGWERVYTSQPDVSLFGGPARPSMNVRGGGYELVSSRQFVYGPGEGGITCEYLFEKPGAEEKVLLARTGAVSNLGGNYFVLDFSTPLYGFEVAAADGSYDAQLIPRSLAPLSGASGRVDGGPSVKGLTLHTTYLSDRMWILRPFGEGASLAARSMDEFVVLRRTETRSVVDRRGLIADGQLKPPDDEGIRYGKLLFGETLSDYGGWSDEAMKQAKMDRLTKF